MRDISRTVKGTPASERVCRLIAEKTGGVCLLGFSRGKDSIAAWLWTRRFFHTIIPFHLAAIPHLSFVDRSLAYYEKEFETKIERYMLGTFANDVQMMYYQPAEDEHEIDALGLPNWRYDNNEVADMMRERHDKTLASGGGKDPGWISFGISMHDSLFRRLRMEKLGDEAGYRVSTRVFFPCFDWTQAQIMDCIHAADLKLPDDYLLADRTFVNMNVKHLERLKKLFPEDFDRVKRVYPFIETHLARNEFRRLRAEKRLKAIRKEAGYKD